MRGIPLLHSIYYELGTQYTVNYSAIADTTWETWIASEFNTAGIHIVYGDTTLGDYIADADGNVLFNYGVTGLGGLVKATDTFSDTHGSYSVFSYEYAVNSAGSSEY